MKTPIDTSSTPPSSSTDSNQETTTDVVSGYAFHYLVFGLPGLLFHTIARKLRPDQKDRIFDGVVEKVLPTSKKK